MDYVANLCFSYYCSHLINVLHASHRPWYLKVRLRNVQKGQQSQVERSQHGQHPAEREEQPGPRVGLRAHRASLVVERAPRSPRVNLNFLRLLGDCICFFA